jgi:hypothetical protein
MNFMNTSRPAVWLAQWDYTNTAELSSARFQWAENLPIYRFLQPTKFELAINMKTAKALGLTISSGLFSIADELIE